MLTIFSIPKAFVGHIGVIQRNALKSWSLLEPRCEIIIFGDEEGIAEAAAEIGAAHVPEIGRNELGTPRLDWAFNRVQDMASTARTCYVNSDIILTDDLLATAAAIRFPDFLMVGERIDIELSEPLDFSPGWTTQLDEFARRTGRLHGPTGMDYFVFPTGAVRDMPPFVVGRAGWDNWMVYRYRLRKLPVIDATKAVAVYHQAHDYAHHPGMEKGTWNDSESVANRRIVHDEMTAFHADSATWTIRETGTPPVRTIRYLTRWLDTLPAFYYPPTRYPLVRVLVSLHNVIRRAKQRRTSEKA